MNSVERVKEICKERKIPISKLEANLGFSNGYVGQLKKGVFPADRLAKIASYLDVTTDYILTGEDKKEVPTQEDEREISDDDIMFALWGDSDDVGKDDLDDVKRYAAFVRERKRQK